MIYYLLFPCINPNAFTSKYITIRWYSLMYVVGFFFSLWSVKKSFNLTDKKIKKEDIDNVLYISFLGVLLGGRLGYVLFYGYHIFLNDPIFLFKVWEGGMSFHGGLIGSIISIYLFSKNKKYNFLQVTDIIAPTVPFGLGIGRLGNFINGELYGRVSINTPWSVIFPSSFYDDLKIILKNPNLIVFLEKYGGIPRHPSQIYEIILEGVILFLILRSFNKRSRPVGSISGLFLLCYGILRFVSEFFRQPDIHIGLIYNSLSMGQILCIPMIIFGLIIIIKSYNIFL